MQKQMFRAVDTDEKKEAIKFSLFFILTNFQNQAREFFFDCNSVQI